MTCSCSTDEKPLKCLACFTFFAWRAPLASNDTTLLSSGAACLLSSRWHVCISLVSSRAPGPSAQAVTACCACCARIQNTFSICLLAVPVTQCGRVCSSMLQLRMPVMLSLHMCKRCYHIQAMWKLLQLSEDGPTFSTSVITNRMALVMCPNLATDGSDWPW